jgi:hypothetical protein
MAKKTQIKTSAKRSSGAVSKKSTSAPRDRIDPRKKLLARVAGNIAGSVVSDPSPGISSAEAIATIAVDIAEQILLKAGIPAEPIASETYGGPYAAS